MVAVPCDGCVPVFYDGLEGSRCFRVPTILRTSHGTLLAFAENRVTDCGDDGPDHALVLRRSVDNGISWGPLINVRRDLKPPCENCPSAISNPNPVEVTLGSTLHVTRAILLHFDTLNNPSKARHGLGMQMWSHDDGLTWSTDATVLAYPPQPNMGAMPGPSVGLQAASGRIYFSAHLAFAYWDVGLTGDASSYKAFLYWSDDLGTSWTASEQVSAIQMSATQPARVLPMTAYRV